MNQSFFTKPKHCSRLIVNPTSQCNEVTTTSIDPYTEPPWHAPLAHFAFDIVVKYFWILAKHCFFFIKSPQKCKQQALLAVDGQHSVLVIFGRCCWFQLRSRWSSFNRVMKQCFPCRATSCPRSTEQWIGIIGGRLNILVTTRIISLISPLIHSPFLHQWP